MEADFAYDAFLSHNEPDTLRRYTYVDFRVETDEAFMELPEGPDGAHDHRLGVGRAPGRPIGRDRHACRGAAQLAQRPY